MKDILKYAVIGLFVCIFLVCILSVLSHLKWIIGIIAGILIVCALAKNKNK